MKKIIDLTMPIEEGMSQHPNHGRTPIFLSGTRNHIHYRAYDLSNPYDKTDFVTFQNEQIIVCGHTGTHMDACFHGDPKSKCTIDKMPLEYGYGNAIWLDVSHRFGPKVAITDEDLKYAEERCGSTIEPGDIVLIYTGWSTVLDPHKYSTEYMGLAKEAGEWLREKKVKTVGIDTCNIDAHGVITHPVHMNFLRPRSLGLKNDEFIVVLENLVNVNLIPKSRFTFIGVPIPYAGATGSQIRAMAVVE